MTEAVTTTVAQAVARTLAAYGTDYYFCLTGGDHDLWLSLHDAGISIVNCRSEAAATYMADGYARATGRPAFVYGQRGPGAANVAAALADAYWASSPVVSLTTSIAAAARDRFQYQDVDTLPFHEAVTSWNRSLPTPAHAPAMIRAAIRAATGPVPGPVHLEIPADMLASDVGPADIYAESVGNHRPSASPDAVSAIVDVLGAAERPLIVAGHGVVLSHAWTELQQLAETFDVPVATTLGGRGAIDDAHPLAVGAIGRYSRRVANATLRDADVVLVVGSRLGGLATNGWTLPFGEKRLLQVDIDPAVIGHNFRVEVGAVADARTAVAQIVAEAHSRGLGRAATAWSRRISAEVARWQEAADGLARTQVADGIHPAEALARLSEAMAPEDLLVSDTGGIAAWAGTLFPRPAGVTYIRSSGSLGWALPGAAGAALGSPGRRTVALLGDGGFFYHIGELETIARMRIPLVVVVLNNEAFASEYHLLKHSWGRADLPAVTSFGSVDLAALAQAFGIRGTTVTVGSDLKTAFAEAFAHDGASLIDVRISREAVAPSEIFRGDGLV